MNALLLEDLEPDAEMVRRAAPAVRWTTVSSLEPAALALRSRTFDVIVADLHLGDAAGAAVIEALRKLAPATPILAISGDFNHELAAAVASAGADGVAFKEALAGLEYTIINAQAHRRQVAEIERLLLTDPMTRLSNRRAAEQRLAAAIAKRRRGTTATPIAILAIDVDDFKAVNAAVGHPGGDAALKCIGDRLRETIRPSDMAARIGGDEFLVIAEDVRGEHGARRLAQRILEKIAEPVALTPTSTMRALSVSIGVAMYPGDGATLEELIVAADGALFCSKRAGKRKFSVAKRRRADTQPSLVARAGAAFDAGELAVAYQPIVDLNTNATIGYEALLRCPSMPNVPVESLVAAIEQSARVHDVSLWVLARAASFAASTGRWVSINVSVQRLARSWLDEEVCDACEVHGMPPSRIHVEVTERSAVSPMAKRTIHKCRERGISVWADDFMKSYSALTTAQEMPIVGVKIDRDHTALIDRSEQARRVVAGVIELAHALELDIIAEGIERPEQRQILLDCGVTKGQGFLFGRPEIP